jgi:hypothetical protein
VRKRDEPGTYRIRQRPNGRWFLSGVKYDGNRVKLDFGNGPDAEAAARLLFPSPVDNPPPNVELDDWGLPVVVSPDTVTSVREAIDWTKLGGATPPPPIDTPKVEAPPTVPVDPKTEKAKEQNAARAKTLCEFFGVAWAAGDVWIAKKITTSVGKEPCNPSPKQVTELAKATQNALVEMFGDLEVGPWTMALLLSLALPISMLIQSPKRKALPPENLQEAKRTGLSAV